MELSEYLRKVVNKKYNEKTLKDRRTDFAKNRRETRNNILLEKRRIKENELSPIVNSPVRVTQPKKKTAPSKKEKLRSRLEQLQKWKIEREKNKLEAKEKKKPLFKVCHAPVEFGLPKPIIPKNPIRNNSTVGYNFKQQIGASRNMSKKNITPKNLKSTRVKKSFLWKVDEVVGGIKNIDHLTPKKEKSVNANACFMIPGFNKISTSSICNVKPDKSSTPLIDNNITMVSINNSIGNLIIQNTSENEQTPKRVKKVVEEPVYTSPFVTISRGKQSARKEFKIRQSTGGVLPSAPQTTSPKAASAYFNKLLNDEIDRIQDLCDEWNVYHESPNIPEEAIDMIDVAIGQSKLLISKKFKQFRGLIERCASSNSGKGTVTCMDLHGFWDMLYIQVEDLDRRFKYLKNLKDNNWKEIIPANQNVKQTKQRNKSVKATASSGLREIIKAARNRQKELQETQTSDTNHNSPSLGQYNAVRRSLRVSMLSSQQEKKRNTSSPGLTMMKVSQAIKSGDGFTPSKSILKTDLTRSAKKSVVFKDALEDDKENDNKEGASLLTDKKGQVDSSDVFNSTGILRRSARILRRVSQI